MSKYFNIIFLLLLWLPFSAGARSYYEYVDSADTYINSGEWKKAENSILNALKLEPSNYNNSLLLSNLATIQRMQGRYSEAVNNYTVALNITPNAVTLLNNRGVLYLEIDSIAKAKSDFVRAMELDEKDIQSKYYCSLILINEGKFDDAKSLIKKIREIEPNTIEAVDATAKVSQAEKNYHEAIRNYNHLINIERKIEWIINRAECFLATKSYAQASEDIAEAIEADPENGYVYLLKALLKKNQFESEESLKNIELAVKYGIDRDYAEYFVKNGINL